VIKISIWHYNNLTRFNEEFYRNLITNNNLVEEIVYRFKEFESDNEEWWLCIKNKKKYFLPVTAKDGIPIVDKLPLKVTETPVRGHWKEKVVNIVTSFSSTKVKPEKKYEFRDLVDNFCNLKHENPQHWLLYKLLFFSAILDRVNFRACGLSNFGKDCIMKVSSSLLNNCNSFSPRSMAAIEYRLYNEILGLNEVSLISPTEYNDLRRFLLECGDFKNRYEKGTRKSSVHNTRDWYDIKNLSLILTYNPIFYYKQKNKEKSYFDFVFDHAILDRYPAFLFKGR